MADLSQKFLDRPSWALDFNYYDPDYEREDFVRIDFDPKASDFGELDCEMEPVTGLVSVGSKCTVTCNGDMVPVRQSGGAGGFSSGALVLTCQKHRDWGYVWDLFANSWISGSSCGSRDCDDRIGIEKCHWKGKRWVNPVGWVADSVYNCENYPTCIPAGQDWGYYYYRG